ncbi:hypothetical protein FA048_09595 [Pedobacter polaris]|uniref:Gliding motility-associated C-terminal domain-containing protein n=1 Tax=Pedobacter polaris TaxID=2571273 RepID=A0A4U1CRX2_9SPHI|nr:hypothetical protein [Pedobacter polaris]TKC10433.1 hypothetical protein FA048_09595 [Pedobacter polaris]
MRIILIVMLMLLTSISFAQNTGIGTTTPTEKLDVATGNLRVRDINTTIGAAASDKVVTANTTGVLKAVEFGEHKAFTTVQMNAISSPNPGRTIYNSDEKSLYTYNGTNWVGQNSKTFSVAVDDVSTLTINTPAELTSTFTLAGKQNVLVTANFVPMCNSNGVNVYTNGVYNLVIDGVAQNTRNYTIINAASGELPRHSSVATWSGSLAPGSHTIIFRVLYTSGSVATNASDRRMDIFIH